MTRTRSLLAVAAALLLLPTAVTSAADATPSAHRGGAPKTDLTIKRTATGTVVSGSKVTFAGIAPASLAGAHAQLQRRVGKKGKWISVDRFKIGPKHTLQADGIATGSGLNAWRFVSTKKHVTHVSKTIGTTVYAWFYLADQDAVDYDGGYSGSWTIGGKNYGKSVGGDGSSATDWSEYNLSYRCTTLDAWIGLGDDSQTGTTADFYITLDGARSFVGSKGLGAATHIVVDTSTRLRIRLEEDPTNPDGPDGYWAFGNAKVLCSGRP